MKNHGFLMKKRGVFDEKTGMSQHAVFSNSHSGIFQTQTSLGTLKDPQRDFGHGIFHCVSSKTLHAVTSPLFSSKTLCFFIKNQRFFIENPRYLHQKPHAFFIKKNPGFFHQKTHVFSSKTPRFFIKKPSFCSSNVVVRMTRVGRLN